MKPIALLFSASVAVGLFVVIRSVGHIDPPAAANVDLSQYHSVNNAAQRVNARFRNQWESEDIEPAGVADDLAVYRRLSLALHGTVPSLEEIRSFLSDGTPDRLDRWLVSMLDDERFVDYFSERLTRMLTGIEEGQFVLYRRDRLRAWLAGQLRSDAPWSDTVWKMIAGDGLWTDSGHTNFITSGLIPDEGLDLNKLAGKTVRSFLGQRMDCAQCHDHFFADWKQTDFEGIAAFYGQTRITFGGVVDRRIEESWPIEYRIVDPGEEMESSEELDKRREPPGRVVPPIVPFGNEWLPSEGSRRQQLASWVVHGENRRFRRAVANRVWGLMFGRSWFDPVDDLPDPGDDLDVLDLLADEFAAHDDSLRFLIRTIAHTEVFRLRSDAADVSASMWQRMSDEWAVFPLVRLRPEQVIGSMFQAGNILTIDQNSHVFTRFARFSNENDFLQQYGETADDELLRQTGTIPQALLRMNGQFTKSLTGTDLLRSAGQILSFSKTDEAIVDNCYLTCLSRLPTSEERAVFQKSLAAALTNDEKENSAEADEAVLTRQQAVADLFWVLFNSPEFSWNH